MNLRLVLGLALLSMVVISLLYWRSGGSVLARFSPSDGASISEPKKTPDDPLDRDAYYDEIDNLITTIYIKQLESI